MTCPVCKALHEEHSQECELEAKAILRQNGTLFVQSPAPPSARDAGLDDVILVSRKRQLEIASKLNEHKARAHVA